MQRLLRVCEHVCLLQIHEEWKWQIEEGSEKEILAK